MCKRKPAKKLIVFNIEMDVNSHFLAANLDLVQSFKRHYDEIIVYATHVGTNHPIPGVRIIGLGGGNWLNRLRGGIKLALISLQICLKRHNTVIFYHMVTRIPAVFGRLFRQAGIPQYLWYSHSVADKYLLQAIEFVDFAFSPSAESFPIATKKMVPVGHGVKKSTFVRSDSRARMGVITVGRVVPIKRIEVFIEHFANMTTPAKQLFSPLIVVGDFTIDVRYVDQVRKYAYQAGLEIVFTGQLPRAELPALLNQSQFYFLGTPKSIDKAAIEAAMCGCIILSDNLNAVSMLGPDKVPGKDLSCIESLGNQIATYSSISSLNLMEASDDIARKVALNNDVDVVVDRIVKKIYEN